jgi:hypothetical protein
MPALRRGEPFLIAQPVTPAGQILRAGFGGLKIVWLTIQKFLKILVAYLCRFATFPPL